MKVQVLLARPISGLDIVRALKAKSGSSYYERTIGGDDKGRIFFAGQRSRFDYENLRIGVGSEAVVEVQHREMYPVVWVVAHDYPGDRPQKHPDGDVFRERYLVHFASQLCIAITQLR